MKTAPITPARFGLASADAQAPGATAFERHHNLDPAWAQARQTCTAGIGQPARWQQRQRFVVLETGFGLGHNFLATWDAWQRDPQRCQHLHYVAVEKHPPRPADLQCAHRGSPLPELSAQLLQAWPPLTANVHSLSFAAGRVHLLLALGDVATLLPALRATADAIFYVAGPGSVRNPAMGQLHVLKALGRMAAPGATLCSWVHTPTLQAGLATAGFEPLDAAGDCVVGGADASAGSAASASTTAPCVTNNAGVVRGPTPCITRAVHRPRPAAQATAAARRPASACSPRSAVVVGAGLAGAAAARALALQGLQVTVLEACAEPASLGSGNVAGLFHGTVHADDGRHARLHRAAALLAQRTYAAAIEAGVPGQQAGLLRLEQRPSGLLGMLEIVARQAWPADYVQALSAAEASRLAGVDLASPAWFYPGGGWVSPPRWVQSALDTPGVHCRTGHAVGFVQRDGMQWQACAADGRLLAAGDVMVLANAQSAAALLQQLGHAAWPLVHTRGQVTLLPAAAAASTGSAALRAAPSLALRLPVAGDGYALQWDGDCTGAPAAGATGWLLCGASSAEGQPLGYELPAVTAVDHEQNLQRLQRLLGPATPLHSGPLQGRAAWRLGTNDRLPVAGAVPLPQWPAGQRLDQARLLPRVAGLFVLTALGARGLTLAPLLAQLVAAQACGTPWPLEQDLADAVDPARWCVRAARRGAA